MNDLERVRTVGDLLDLLARPATTAREEAAMDSSAA
jgi:hypothetical protein